MCTLPPFQCSRERSGSLPNVVFGTRSERQGNFGRVPNVWGLRFRVCNNSMRAFWGDLQGILQED